MIAEATTASSSIVGACFLAQLPDAGTIDAVGRWPLVAVLGAVACFCVWLMYKQSKDFAKAMSENSLATAKAITDLVAELKQRPCMRDPKNN